jgi:hypothetical protein
LSRYALPSSTGAFTIGSPAAVKRSGKRICATNNDQREIQLGRFDAIPPEETAQVYARLDRLLWHQRVLQSHPATRPIGYAAGFGAFSCRLGIRIGGLPEESTSIKRM